MINRMLDDGTLIGIAHGVYATSEPSWRQQVWAGILLGGDTCVIGGLAAARLQDLVASEPEIIECYLDPGVRRSRTGPWRFIRSQRTWHNEPRRTLIPQTIVDASHHMDDDAIAAMITGARRRLNLGSVEQVLAHTLRHPKRDLLLQILHEVADGAESSLEIRYRRDVEYPHKLPAAMHQLNLTGKARIDNLYQDYGVIVELDGREFHQGLAASGDSARDNQHLLLGFATLRFNWGQVARTPCTVAAQVAAALRLGGWNGRLGHCRRCGGR